MNFLEPLGDPVPLVVHIPHVPTHPIGLAPGIVLDDEELGPTPSGPTGGTTQCRSGLAGVLRTPLSS
jgi:hypothetical protein